MLLAGSAAAVTGAATAGQAGRFGLDPQRGFAIRLSALQEVAHRLEGYAFQICSDSLLAVWDIYDTRLGHMWLIALESGFELSEPLHNWFSALAEGLDAFSCDAEVKVAVVVSQ